MGGAGPLGGAVPRPPRRPTGVSLPSCRSLRIAPAVLKPQYSAACAVVSKPEWGRVVDKRTSSEIARHSGTCGGGVDLWRSQTLWLCPFGPPMASPAVPGETLHQNGSGV